MQNTSEKQINGYFGIVITQAVFCALILVIILGIKLFDGKLNNEFSNWYNINFKDKTDVNCLLGDISANSDFISPLNDEGVITSNYGYRNDPISGEYKMHNGLDIAAKKGSDVLSVSDSVVYKTGFDDGYGNYIIIKHTDGFDTLYGHCDGIVAKTGDTVKQGDIIATVGSTGRSTGNHLHFEVRKDNLKVNPLWIIG
jgi:hypothetical protein